MIPPHEKWIDDLADDHEEDLEEEEEIDFDDELPEYDRSEDDNY